MRERDRGRCNNNASFLHCPEAMSGLEGKGERERDQEGVDGEKRIRRGERMSLRKCGIKSQNKKCTEYCNKQANVSF